MLLEIRPMGEATRGVSYTSTPREIVFKKRFLKKKKVLIVFKKF